MPTGSATVSTRGEVGSPMVVSSAATLSMKKLAYLKYASIPMLDAMLKAR